MEFNPTTAAVLCAAMDRVVPADDFPGAADAGVAEFIARIFETETHLPSEAFLRGMDSLNAESVFSHPFVSLTPAQQDDVLQRVEEGSVRSQWLDDPKAFFTMLINLTSEGYYSDPGNGGNRDKISWKMVGYDPRGNE
jgi:hypothetical protein